MKISLLIEENLNVTCLTNSLSVKGSLILTLLISPATFAITYKKYSCDYTKDIEACDGSCIHSGVTLAPLIGQLLASEVLEASKSPLLEAFRPNRFLN